MREWFTKLWTFCSPFRWHFFLVSNSTVPSITNTFTVKPNPTYYTINLCKNFFFYFFLGGVDFFKTCLLINSSITFTSRIVNIQKKALTYKPAAKIIHQFLQLVTLSWQYIISQTEEWNTQYNEKRLSCAPLTSHKISIFLSAWQEIWIQYFIPILQSTIHWTFIHKHTIKFYT